MTRFYVTALFYTTRFWHSCQVCISPCQKNCSLGMLQLYLFQVFPFFLILDIKTSLQVVTWTFSAFLPRKQQITQFRSKNPTKTSVSVVRVRSGALFSSTSSCPLNVLLLSATNHFRVLDPFFFIMFSGKKIALRPQLCCALMKKASWWFLMSWKNLLLVKTFFLIRSFSIDEGSGNDDNVTN